MRFLLATGNGKLQRLVSEVPVRNLKPGGTTNAGVFECFYIFAPAQGLVAQWIEQQPSKLRVIGSNPIGVTTKTQPVNQKITGCVFFTR